MQQPEPDALMGATLIAQHRYPYLDYEDVVDQLDDLAEQIQVGTSDYIYSFTLQAFCFVYYKGNRECFRIQSLL